MAHELCKSHDEVDVSLSNLITNDFVVEPNQLMTGLSPFGREFLRTVYD